MELYKIVSFENLSNLKNVFCFVRNSHLQRPSFRQTLPQLQVTLTISTEPVLADWSAAASLRLLFLYLVIVFKLDINEAVLEVIGAVVEVIGAVVEVIGAVGEVIGAVGEVIGAAG